MFLVKTKCIDGVIPSVQAEIFEVMCQYRMPNFSLLICNEPYSFVIIIYLFC